MSSPVSEATLRDIESLRSQLHDVVDKKIDDLKQTLISGKTEDREYPLSAPPSLFKGTKPTAVIFAGARVEVKTWREAYTGILRRCYASKPEALMYLRNRVSGRKRTILSDKPDGMNAPIKLADDLFAEAYFDTEWLVRILTIEILGAAGYDYSGISVLVKNGKRAAVSNVPSEVAPYINDTVFEQIMDIRKDPDCPNMFDSKAVFQLAIAKGYDELADFIFTYTPHYSRFILTGQR